MRTRPKHDEGFTLIEVIIAVALLLGVAVALGAFAMQSLRLAAQQQRTQVAVTVATQRMDEVQRLTTSNAQLATLVAGRSETAVKTAWSAASGVPGLAQTYPAWPVVSGGPPAIPIQQTTTRSGSAYASTVLIGTCYQPVAGGACTRISGASNDPGAESTLAAGRSQMIRVIVVVTYPGACDSGSTCRYTASGLFDTRGDLKWRTE
ncbi:type II secretion system protein [Microbacterium sp. YMB-B2]|uniref:Type II secretion system protein n=1 Tax=Microbacterium tenebrionis TaxID=2830665 RepID=A0A9X1LMI4_9MICO|nr:type II secretion system protein [Microbacterium tenebrionis]MCC2028411.1 type II secretion system protein [Microbacterium tenebrionis]